MGVQAPPCPLLTSCLKWGLTVGDTFPWSSPQARDASAVPQAPLWPACADLVLCSDCLFFEDFHAHLAFTTLCLLLGPPGSSDLGDCGALGKVRAANIQCAPRLLPIIPTMNNCACERPLAVPSTLSLTLAPPWCRLALHPHHHHHHHHHHHCPLCVARQRAWFLAPARGGSLDRFVGAVQALADGSLWPYTVAVSVDPAFDPDVTSHFDARAAADPAHNADKERPLLVEVSCHRP